MYGIGVNGNTPKAMLDGTVITPPNEAGRVVIATNYFFRYCNRADPKVCWNTAIMQESVNLTTIAEGLKAYSKVKIGDVIGTATSEKPEFIRFYVGGNGSRGREVTITPKLVWKYAIPVEKLTDEEKKNIGLESTADTPSGPVTPTQTGSATFVGRVGSTGESTGPHVHIQESTSSTLSESALRTLASKYVFVDGKSLTTYTQGQGFGAGRGHKGIDYPIEEGKEIYVTGSIVSVGPGVGGSKCGVGAAFKPPEGPELLICHMREGSAPPSSGTQLATGSKVSTGVQTAPTSLGAELTTSFRGIPRALRIIPGRTILSFVTKYDEWVEQGRPASIDPGVWIAGRFSRWFVKDVNYQWGQGDLRVSVSGITDWGNITSRLNTPTFEEYMAAFQKSGDFTERTTDYYGYIRSAGDLCWLLKDGKTSCEVFCADAQQFQNYLRAGQDQADPTIGGSFPNSQCEYTGTAYRNKKAEIEQVMGALRTMGINTKEAYSGVLGNLADESGFEFNIHNTSRQNLTCTTDSSDPPAGRKEKCYGIAQWGGVRKQNILKRYGQTSSLTNQLQFMANEIKEGRDARRDTPQIMNGAKSPEEAANLWNQYYERGSGGIPNRSSQARIIFDGLKCARVNP
jgi:hypothetical protein